jgi:Mg2+/Co2+ transporter CorC
MPSASRIVTTAGSPSGIAATAKLIAVMKSANGSPPCKRPTAKIMAQIARKRIPRILPRRFKFSCRGVASVYDEDIDDIVGILIVKDLLRVPKSKRGADFKLESILRPAFFVPEVKKVDVLFREMKQQHTTLAVVVDEYGGTEGIVTMEDLLEEIVGEIEDEYDAPVTSVVVNADGSYVFSGLLTPAEAGRYVPELDELKEDDDFDTIAGFVLSLLGYIPEKRL